MKTIFIRILILLTFAGCSTPGVQEPYTGTGETQINVTFDGNWSVGSKSVYLGIYEMIKTCDYKFLGDIKINDEAHQSIMIPSGKKVILRTVFVSKGYNSRKERTQDFLFVPKKEQVYDVAIYERDGFLGNNVRLLGKNGKTEIDTMEEKCAHR